MSHRSRRKGRSIALLATVTVLLAAGVLFVRLISTKSVSSDSAIDQFRQEQAATPQASEISASAVPGETTSGTGNPSTSKRTGAEAAGTGAAARGVSGSDCEWACVMEPIAPLPGVYEYFQCGKTRGQCEGSETEPKGREGSSLGGAEIGRDFPPVGYRNVTRQTPQRWKSVHLHHQEHEQEFQTSIDTSGVFLHAYKESVVITGRTFAVDVNFHPALRLANFPFGVGESWSGRWRDNNGEADGYYSTQVVAQEEVRVVGKSVRVWHVLVDARLTGPKASGNFVARLWMSPQLRLTLQEQFEIAVELEGVPYWGRWRTTSSNLEAQR